MKALIGRTLGNCQIVEEIGRGGKAIVYKAIQPALQRYVAIKVLPPQFTLDTTLQRFQREATAAARLRHPHIVTIYDVGQQDGLYYIVMEYLEGMTLSGLIRQQGSLPLERATHIMQQVASALDYAHDQGFVHRDVKPDNIIVGSGDHATLTDFGIVKAIGGTTLTRTGMMIGTPQYMSPEQAEGREVDYRADIYSLGIVCYEMLTGRVPFGGEILAVLYAHLHESPPPIRSLRSDLPVEVEIAIHRALAKEPEARYASTMQFAQALTAREVPESTTLVAKARERASNQLATTGDVTEPIIRVTRPMDQKALVEGLIVELSSDDEKARTNAREKLVETGEPAVEPLIQALQDTKKLVRWSAAWALGVIGDVRAVEPLIGLLQDPNARVRWEAAGALGKIGDARAVEPLIALSQDPDAGACRGAAGALGKIGDARAVEPLIALLRDPDTDVRRGAAKALGQIGRPAVESLISLLWDPDADVRWRAARALGEIGDARAVELLISLLRDLDAGVRRGAAGALGRIGSLQALPYLRWVVENEADSIVCSAAQEAIERMQEKASGQDQGDKLRTTDRETATWAAVQEKAEREQPIWLVLERAVTKLNSRSRKTRRG